MIRITDDRRKVEGIVKGAVWVGSSNDEESNIEVCDIGAVLNVAQDLVIRHSCKNGFEVAQVGLVDGPGNDLARYGAAILTLHSLLRRHNVLVCCHSGSRAMAVTLMYLNTTARRDWDGWIQLLGERLDVELPVVNEAHRTAFDKMNWNDIYGVMDGARG